MEVSRHVVRIWRVVCGERGRGIDICLVAEVGAIVAMAMVLSGR